MSIRIFRVLLGVFLAMPAFVSVAQDHQYPVRPITLIVPFAPGGSSDLLARKYANLLEKKLGTTVVVENRGGGSGVIGAQAVARARPDGYTLLLAHTTGIAVLPLLRQDIPYDVDRDFNLITLLGATPQVLVVPPNGPQDLDSFVALARSQGGKLNYSSGGVATPPHLVGELFKLRAGLDIVHVPFNGSTASIASLLGGHMDAAFQNIDSLLPHIQAGTLRALAIASTTRSDALPDVPTLEEKGIQGVENQTWFGIAAPAGLPASVYDTLVKASTEVVTTDEFQAYLRSQAVNATPAGPEAFKSLLDEERQRWRQVIEAADIRLS